MADFGAKPKAKKSRLPPPPPETESSDILDAPEVAPAALERKPRNKTHRTVAFGTRVTAEFDALFRETAFRQNRKHTQLLEEMLVLYRQTHNLDNK